MSTTTKQGKYGLYDHVRILIQDHLQYEDSHNHFGRNQNADDCQQCVKEIKELASKYKVAEKLHIDFIRAQANSVRMAEDLLDLFSGSIYSFAILGLRADLIKKKITSNNPAPTDKSKLDQAVRKGVNGSAPTFNCEIASELDSILGNNFSFDFGCEDAITRLINSAFCRRHDFVADAHVMMTSYLYYYLGQTGNGLSKDLALFQTDSIADLVTTSTWADRPLIGYYRGGADAQLFGDFKSVINVDFFSIFAQKIDMLFNTVNIGDKDYFIVEAFKSALSNSVHRAYFGAYSEIDRLRVYNSTADAIDIANKATASGKPLTYEMLNTTAYFTFLDDSALLRKMDVSGGMTYELNKPGLLSFVNLIESLGLDGQSGFEAIADRIHGLTC